MILNQNQQSDAQLIGDIQNNKVGIDTNNLDFITSLLTTNLYSQPIQSFIRETVANGWDSHVEAGTTDKPVIIRVYTNDKGEVNIAVRDYGTGLSPERFNEIYLNIGSSTKRESNDYIGQFGIGRFASLSVSNIVCLTNYYQGTCNKFLMYKDAGKICIDKIFETATEEENGLEVTVNTETNIWQNDLCKKITLGIKQLTFYYNVYIDDPECLLTYDLDCSVKEFNNRKIKDFKTFKICNQVDIRNSLLMGNVLYPIDTAIIKSWFPGPDFIPFAIKCDIGDVDITPSRETLLYSQKTIDAINKRCENVLEEIKEICQNTFDSDFETIEDYNNFMYTGHVNITLAEFDDKTITLPIPYANLGHYGLSNKITLNGNPIPNGLVDYYRRFTCCNLPSVLVTYCYSNKRFYIKGNNLSISRYIDYCNDKKLYLIDEPLKPVVKKYFSEHNQSWKNQYFLNKNYIYSSFRKIVREFCNVYKTHPTDPLLKIILKDFKDHYTNIPTYGIKNVPQEYIDEIKATAKQNKVAAQQKARKCVIYQLIEGRSYNSISYDTNRFSYEDLKSFKGTIFFAEKDNAYLEAFWKFQNRCSNSIIKNILIVEVALSNLHLMRELKNAVEFNTIFVTKNNLISKICTYIYLCEKWNITRRNLYFDNEKSPEYRRLGDIIYTLQHMYYFINNNEGIHTALPELLKTLCTTYYKNGWLNYELISFVESNVEYLKLNNIFGDRSSFDDIIFAVHEYLTKNNITNQERFNRIKNTLKPILNEYTPNSELPHFNIG